MPISAGDGNVRGHSVRLVFGKASAAQKSANPKPILNGCRGHDKKKLSGQDILPIQNFLFASDVPIYGMKPVEG